MWPAYGITRLVKRGKQKTAGVHAFFVMAVLLTYLPFVLICLWAPVFFWIDFVGTPWFIVVVLFILALLVMFLVGVIFQEIFGEKLGANIDMDGSDSSWWLVGFVSSMTALSVSLSTINMMNTTFIDSILEAILRNEHNQYDEYHEQHKQFQ